MAACEYVSRGWAVVRIPYKKKAPRERDWQRKAITTPAAAEQYFRGPMNIGVLVGPASGGPMDVDLDCGEAIELADEFLPPTVAEFGRPSKPRSHRLYYVDGVARTLQFKDPRTGEMLLELRGDKRDGTSGYQTVFPPSIHLSGEAIEWEKDGEPAQVDYADLKRAVTLLAICCLIRRYCPSVAGDAEAEIALDRIDPRLESLIDRFVEQLDQVFMLRVFDVDTIFGDGGFGGPDGFGHRQVWIGCAWRDDG